MELLTKQQRTPVLTYARKLCETGKLKGMCSCIGAAKEKVASVYISEFNYTVAKDLLGATGSHLDYWWPLSDRESRIRYFDWLIEQEKIK